jgi:hypothetical protein
VNLLRDAAVLREAMINEKEYFHYRMELHYVVLVVFNKYAYCGCRLQDYSCE